MNAHNLIIGNMLAINQEACSGRGKPPPQNRVLFSKLQTCYIASGMDDLDPSVTPDTMPSVEQRSDILQSFLDCCSKQDFPAIEALEARKQKSNGEEVSSLLKELQSTIQAVYKKYLMGSSVGLTVPGS
ncbi:uncharacterized protein LOC122380609 isoform X2 [Amphibalanus amphitrite]|uniref:uncharacterized protein LOC122380609 isoform X2 n=1 Tax=Amphibalanus amphitrite TaxID=1232801 RepID=UPI001C9025D8|nr:uncharacterized protein LOC122380609 isoform X2 [Amphibalanus amphitrite]